MSKVGNVDEMFGKNFSIVTTNASASDIINDTESTFVASALILASPVDENGNDLGYPTLIATDASGAPLRLTYTIKPGNGLVLAYSYAIDKQDFSEVLSLAIDNDTLKTSNEDGSGYLFVSASGITEFSQYLLTDSYNNIDVDINELHDGNKLVLTDIPTSDDETVKVTRLTVDVSKLIDNVTLKSNKTTDQAAQTYFSDQTISVNLSNLIDNKTISEKTREDGLTVLSVDANYIEKTSSSTYGVVKIDNTTIKTNKNGQIYVKTSELNKVTEKGGVGIVFVAPKGNGSIYSSTYNGLSIDTSKMDRAGENKFGVCAVDGVTITANQNGVLRALSGKVATNNTVGTVKPDNSTLIINNAGTLSVNSSNLTKGSSSEYGIVKFDNNTIVKNTSGSLSVKNASKWDAAISDLKTQMTAFSSQLTAIKAEVTNILAKISNTVNAQLSLFTIAGKQLNTMTVEIPNIAEFRGLVKDWNTADANGTFTLNYGAGYIFNCRLSGGTNASWMQNCQIVINNQPYGMNQDIKLDSNSAVCSLKLTIAGYPKSSTAIRQTVSYTLEFKDQSGNPLKSMTLYITSPKDKTEMSNFTCSFNGSMPNTVTADSTVVSQKLGELVKTTPLTVGITSKV